MRFFSGRERRIGTLVNVNSARLLCLLRCLSFCLSNRVTLLTAISSGCHLRNWAPAVKDDDFLPPSKKRFLKNRSSRSTQLSILLNGRQRHTPHRIQLAKKSRHKDKSSSNFLAVCRTRPIHRIFFFCRPSFTPVTFCARRQATSSDKKKWQTIGARLKRGNSQNCEQ